MTHTQRDTTTEEEILQNDMFHQLEGKNGINKSLIKWMDIKMNNYKACNRKCWTRVTEYISNKLSVFYFHSISICLSKQTFEKRV